MKKKPAAPPSDGRFAPDGKSFEITNVRLRGVWDHYLSNDVYAMLLSQTWCGYSFYRSRACYPVSMGGRFAFLRDEDSGEAWTVNEPPAKSGEGQTYESLHGLSGDQTAGADRFRTPLSAPNAKGAVKQSVTLGLGWIALIHERAGLRVEMKLRVAGRDPVEIWDVKVTNLTRRRRRLAFMPTVTFHLGAGIAMAGNSTVCMFTDIDRRARAVFARMEGIRSAGLANIVGFLAAADGAPDGYFGTLDSAQDAVLSPAAKEREAKGEEAVALVRLPLKLRAHGAAKMTFLVGAAPGAAAAKKLVRKFQSAAARKADECKVQDFWTGVASRQVIQTPDASLNRFYNSWLKYEMMQTARWNRGQSWGYRDILQDSEGALLLDPPRAWRMIIEALARQRSDGWAARGFDMAWPKLVSLRDFRDSAVWIVFALDSYLRETGRLDALKETAPFLDRGRATVFEHAFRACRFLMTHRGAHGLPLIAEGDWNDALDRAGIAGKGESVWLAIALHRALVMLRDIALRADYASAAAKLEAWRARIEKSIQKSWDGAWYVRAYDDSGRVLGSRSCREGKIFLLPQAWAAFSGLKNRRRIEQALDSADKYLRSAWGPPKLWPGYTKRDDRIGRITVRAPGLGENAGIHTHAVTFKIKADLALGRGSAAYATLRKVAPVDGHPASRIPVEPPYTLCNQRVGPEHPDFGAHKNRWLSGSVSWLFRLITEDMLGARAEIDGLRVRPCLPASWTGCRIERAFRGAVYDVHVVKRRGVERGKVRLTLDGRKLAGDVLPVLGDGRKHLVICSMGE